MATLYYVPAETRRWLKKARDAVETLLSANSFDVAAADALAHRTVYPPVELPMPAFGNEPLSLELQHGDAASPVEYLCFDANEKFPDHFAAMWHAGRDRYRKILAACPARNFLVYDVHHKTDGPMAIYEMRGEAPFKYAKVAEAVASDGECGSFAATCHGIFDDPPSPEVLAFISCRLAATGRWLALVPHQYDFVPPDILALMNGTTEEPVGIAAEERTLVANN